MIVCCVRGSRISVTMGMVSSSRVPPIAARFTVDLAMNPCSLSFLCLYVANEEKCREALGVALHDVALLLLVREDDAAGKLLDAHVL